MVFPLLLERFPGAKEALARFAEVRREEEEHLGQVLIQGVPLGFGVHRRRR